MPDTIKQMIQGCLPIVGLPADPIQNDVRDLCLAVVNYEGKEIFDRWPWDNSKIPEAEYTADSSGIVTLASTVDVVRAVKYVSTDGNSHNPMWPQDEVLAYMQGSGALDSDHFEPYPDDSSGNRRIKVAAGKVVKVLALKKWVDFTSSTYTTLSFPIDRAAGALREYILDALRSWQGIQQEGKGQDKLTTALQREVNQNARETRLVPRNPMFEDVGRVLD